MYETPILLLVWRRPRYVEKQIDTLRSIRAKYVYVASDGLTGDPEIDHNVLESRWIIENAIDWDCNVETLFRHHRLGCKSSVSQAIDWFFSHVGEGIILEDDCLPRESFFSYCELMLEKFRTDEKIMMITGRNELGKWLSEDYDFFYSDGGIWGWATWANRWIHYDGEINGISNKNTVRKVKSFFGNALFFQLLPGFVAAKKGRVDSWAFPWKWQRALRGGLSVTPTVNLVENIGIGDADATHTKSGFGVSTTYEPRKVTKQSLRGPTEKVIDKKYAYRSIARHKPHTVAYRFFVGWWGCIKIGLYW